MVACVADAGLLGRQPMAAHGWAMCMPGMGDACWDVDAKGADKMGFFFLSSWNKLTM